MPQKLRIAHPFPGIPFADRARVQSTISPEVNRYLFKQILPEAGHQAALIAIFFKKFHDECIKRGIGRLPGADFPTQAIWDEDNESRVAQILEDMNFNVPKSKKVKP